MVVIKDDIVTMIQSHYPGTSTENVSVVFLRPLSIPTQNVESVKIANPPKSLLGKTLCKINFYDKKQLIFAQWVPMAIAATRNYVQAAQDIQKGHILNENDVTLSLAAIEGMNAEIASESDSLLGKEATMSIKKGQFLSRRVFQEPFVIYSGQTVDIDIEEDGIVIKYPGVALQSGRVGNMIQVKGKAYSTVLKGVIVDSKTIKISNN